jgi:hypothetical protein
MTCVVRRPGLYGEAIAILGAVGDVGASSDTLDSQRRSL